MTAWRNKPCSRSRTCRRGSNLHFSPPDGRSTRYDRHDFVALACRARCTVQVHLRAPSGPRLVLTVLSRTSPRRVVRNAGLKPQFGDRAASLHFTPHYGRIAREKAVIRVENRDGRVAGAKRLAARPDGLLTRFARPRMRNAGQRRRCFCWPMRILLCAAFASCNAFQSKRLAASFR